MVDAGRHYLQKQGKSTGVPVEELIDTAITSLGLEDISEFDPKQKIIEYQVKDVKGPLVSLDLRDFANELSSDSPAPGGGSTSALAGALASSLASMVASLTFGKPEYRQNWKKMEELAVKAQALKGDLLNAIDLDSEAFNAMMSAFAMKKKTDEQKRARDHAIQEATQNACLVPLDVMKKSLESLKLISILPEEGNQNAVSDAGVASLMALSAIEGAGLNVRINLSSIEDDTFVNQMKSEVDSLCKTARDLQHEIMEKVNQIIK
jgi:glutamate formiminotransferase/formiminotetrahydrofolate cyclodeaminase